MDCRIKRTNGEQTTDEPWVECYNKVKLGKDEVLLNLKMRKRRQINAESVQNSGIAIKKRRKNQKFLFTTSDVRRIIRTEIDK